MPVKKTKTIEKFEKPALKKESKRGGARKGAGRKPFVPTDLERKQVEAMSGHGIPQEQIAVLVRNGIDVDTLRIHFKKELILGKAKNNVKAGQTLFQRGINGDTTALIFWCKTQMKWSETQNIEYSSGIPVHLAAINLSDDQLAAFVHGEN